MKKVKVVFILVLVFIICNMVVRKVDLSKIEFFSFTSLFIYCGVLIGLGLTVYTFSLSIVSEIRRSIDNLTIEGDKITMLNSKLKEAYREIKSNVWYMFLILGLSIVFAILMEIPTPFDPDYLKLKVPETVALFSFLTVTFTLWDITSSMFQLTEVSLELQELESQGANHNP